MFEARAWAQLTLGGNCRQAENYRLVAWTHDGARKTMPIMPYRVASPQPRQRTFIKEWRKFRDKMTQEQLAEKVGMSAANLSRIEKGEQDYTQSVIESIAEALDTDVAALLTRKPKEDEPIWRVWSEATPSQRRQIVEIGKTITRGGDA